MHAMRSPTETLGFRSAVIATICSVAYSVAQIGEWLGWLGSAGGAESLSTPLGIVVLLTPSLVLGSAFLVMVACLHQIAPADRKAWSQSAFAFATVYTALISINYYVQLAWVGPRLAAGRIAGMEPFLFVPFDSFLYAVDILGYSFMSLATLFAARAVVGGGVQRLARCAPTGCCCPSSRFRYSGTSHLVRHAMGCDVPSLDCGAGPGIPGIPPIDTRNAAMKPRRRVPVSDAMLRAAGGGFVRLARHGLAAVVTVSLLGPTPGYTQSADSASGLTVHISVAKRRLWVVDSAGDTLLAARVAVGSGKTLKGETRTWTFRTPLGQTRVSSKDSNPLWVPPDWYYVELARERRLRLERLEPGRPFTLRDGRSLVVRNGSVGILGTDSAFSALPAGRDVIVQGTLFIPPFGTAQRQLPEVLGSYRLRLANGIALHGTPYTESIGRAVTHGCIRLGDDDIAWLYDNVVVGSTVVIR
jgi:lipoprotein-anchoring transpeptidase ErfK/SrfK